MTLVVDAAPLVALADANDARSLAVLRCLERERGELVLPAPITVEADYFLGERLGGEAQERFVEDIASGLYRLEGLTTAEHREVHRLMQHYRGLRPGLADLSVVILAFRFNTLRILTFDYRHFRAMRPLQGGSFQLLPIDEADDA